ncbi:MAG: hypothetical protein Q7S53_01500 [bacterium]|nr:hypothetical protein [bacterium]
MIAVSSPTGYQEGNDILHIVAFFSYGEFYDKILTWENRKK